MNRMHTYYHEVVRRDMVRKFNYENTHNIPKIEKIILSMGVKEAANDRKQILPPLLLLELITGHKAVLTKAKKAVSNFKIRKGFPIGVKVTLRNAIMYEFLSKLITVVLPRIRDFRGLSPKMINKYGTLSLGIRDLLVFPEVEVEFEKLNSTYGVNITIVTNAVTLLETQTLISSFQMPFKNNSI